MAASYWAGGNADNPVDSRNVRLHRRPARRTLTANLKRRSSPTRSAPRYFEQGRERTDLFGGARSGGRPSRSSSAFDWLPHRRDLRQPQPVDVRLPGQHLEQRSAR